MTEAEKVVDSAFVHIELVAGNFAKRRDLGAESDTAQLLRNEQRLDPERIARQPQDARLPIPDCRRIHALRALPGFVAPADEAGEEGFDVAAGAKAMRVAQFPPQLEMIDDLSVADDRVASISAGDRLMSALDVDDAEAAHAETEVTIDQHSRNRRDRGGSVGRTGWR